MEEYYIFRAGSDDSRIIAFLTQEGKNPQKIESKNAARRLLDEMRIPQHKGSHDYISYITMNYRIEWGAITNEIYPEVARLYGTSQDAVEKAIRFAIRDGWPNMPQEYKGLFQNRYSPPKAFEFLTVMRELVEKELIQEFGENYA